MATAKTQSLDTMRVEMKRAPSSRVLLAYALPAFVVALPTIPVYIHLPALYGIELGLGLATTGFVLLIARLFDTVTDPLVGALSDRFSLRGNRRKPWIAVGAVIAGVGLFKILNPPADIDASYLLGWAVVLYGGWTMVAVPYLAWGAELSADYNERTRITAWREGLALLGIIGAAALVAATAGIGWTQADSIGAIAWAAIVLGVISFPLLLWTVPEGPTGGHVQAPTGFRQFWEEAGSLLANWPFLRLLSAWFLNGLANGIPAALFFIYLEHGLGAGARHRPLFVLAYFLAAIVAIPLWQMFSRRIGKHRTWCWAMVCACAAFVTVPFIGEGQFTAFAAVCVVTGMALGADLVLPPAIQADVVDYDELRFGRARAGLQFSLWGMSTKLALAAAVGFALPILEVSGFDPTVPTEAARRVLAVIYALVPVVIKLAAIAIVWRFPLTAKKHVVIRRRLSHHLTKSKSGEAIAP
jgi:Na+/melibiose symporter-like transporter